MMRNPLITLVLLACGVAGCAASEPEGVLQVGSRNLECPRSEMRTTLNRTTPKVREYVVGCDFMYTRVQCAAEGCYAAPLKPPCFGDGACFVEDPVTLQWRLPDEDDVALVGDAER